MEKDRLRPFTEMEKTFAEKNHDIIYMFLRKHRYSIEEYYDIVLFGYLKAVQNYLSRNDLMEKYCFSTIAENCMRREIGNYFRDINRQKRKPLEIIVSLDAIYTEEEKGTGSMYNAAIRGRTVEDEIMEDEAIKNLLGSLTDIQQKIVRLKLDGYTSKEIFEVLEIVPSTYYTEMKRIKAVLQ